MITEQSGTADGPRVKVCRGVTPCAFTYVYRRFGGTHVLHVQSQATKLHANTHTHTLTTHTHTHSHTTHTHTPHHTHTLTTHTHTNSRRQITDATKFCAVAPNIFWSSVWNRLAPIIVIWVNLLKTFFTLGQDVPPTSVLPTITSYSSSLVCIQVTTNSFRYMTLRSHRNGLGLLACTSMFGAL